MLRGARDHRGQRLLLFGRPPAARGEDAPRGRPDWTQARPAEIRRALERSQRLPTGGWYALDASRRLGERPSFFWVAGRELVVWRAAGALRIAPNECPHMGAPLCEGQVRGERLVCPWHGLELGSRHGTWEPLPVHEDGVLAWVRLPGSEPPLERPALATRPSRFLEGTVRTIARCDPADVIANRLDPWHGAHLHAHTFARLRVTSVDEEVLGVRVAFRVFGPLCVEVDCTFHCPDARTIVMTIVEGEGAGSVVETHATPLVPGYTAIVETTLANSERLGFIPVRRAAAISRLLVERTARRLWRDDAAYAERSAYQRTGACPAACIAERGAEVPPGGRARR